MNTNLHQFFFNGRHYVITSILVIDKIDDIKKLTELRDVYIKNKEEIESIASNNFFLKKIDEIIEHINNKLSKLNCINFESIENLIMCPNKDSQEQTIKLNIKFEPLNFWFSSTQPVFDINKLSDDQKKRLEDLLDENPITFPDNLDELIEMYDTYIDDRFEFYKATIGIVNLDCGVYGRRPKTPYDDIIHELNEKMKILDIGNFNKKITISKNNVVNGYNLYDLTEDQNALVYSTFHELKKIWLENKEMSEADFSEEFNNNACTEWYKMDEFGESFGGYWKYPEDSYEKKNAFILTGKKNCEKLYELPYPKKVLLKTIDIGCRMRVECVRYSNFLCYWLSQKI